MPFTRATGNKADFIRRAERLPVNFRVEMTDADGRTQSFPTRNISDTGIFLVTDGAQVPPIGSLVSVRLQGNLGCGEEPPTLSMRITRAETLGIGLQFVDS